MDGAFKFMEGLSFYGTIMALAVMAGVWYFWWHILPKIRKYDQAKNVLDVIVPKIGKDLDNLESAITKITDDIMTSITMISNQVSENTKAIKDPRRHISLIKRLYVENKKLQKAHTRKILQELSSMNRIESAPSNVMDELTTDIPFSIDEDSRQMIGESTEEILDELTIDDIRGFIRKDKTLRGYDGEERRTVAPERRSGRDRRQKTVSIRSERRTGTDRRTGRDRRQDRTIGQLNKLSKIVDVLHDDDPLLDSSRKRRSPRIQDF